MMVKQMLKTSSIILLLFALIPNLKAEIFLITDYNLSARSAGLKNTDLAVSGQPSSVFANPALLTDVKTISGGSSLDRGFEDLNLTSIYGVYPLQDYTIGGGLAYLGYGDFKSYKDQSLTESSQFSAYDFLLVGSIAKSINSNLTAGTNLKFYNSKIENYGSSALGMDLAATYKILDESLTLTGGIFNVGYQLDAFNQTKEDLPMALKGGFSNRFKKIPLELTAQYNYSIHGKSGYSAGLEFKPKPNLHLRAGYDFSSDDKKIGTASQKEKFAGLALGGSAIFKYFGLDLAYQINGELQENWTFGINSWVFDRQKKDSEKIN